MSIPIRPINIHPISTYLLGSVKVGVKFKVKPTVLYAEKHSKATVNNGVPLGSKINMATIEMPIVIREIHKIAKAREVDSDEILLPNTCILLFPLATAKIFNVARAKVLVLIPPQLTQENLQSTLKK